MLATCLTACGPEAPQRVVLIGDSITRGRVSAEEGPPFAELLAAAFPRFEFVNAGCSGATSSDWVRPGPGFRCNYAGAFEKLAAPALPATGAVVLLGTNDATGFAEPGLRRTAPETYRSNLEHVVGRLESATRWVVLVTPPRRPPGDPVADEHLEAFRAEVLALCAAPGAALHCGPDAWELLDPARYFPADIHPNAAGHRALAEALVETLRPLLEAP